MKHLLPYPLLAVGLAGCGHKDSDIDPTPPGIVVDKQAANYDVLANANGHWRWTRTTYPFGQWRDSAYVGYGRHLLFKSDSSVVLRRTAVPDYIIPYTFAVGNNQFTCDSYGRRRIYFNTGETQLPANNRYKTVKLYPDAQGLPSFMLLAQDGECLDAGGIEAYYWVYEK